MAEIGILHGNKESFPQAVMEALNRHRKGCCRMLCVDALDLQDSQRWGWDTPLIFDLFSGQMPYLREALHLLSQLEGRLVLNPPELARQHNRATLRRAAAAAGLSTARSVLLPARSAPAGFPKHGFINLRFPLAWEEIFAQVGPYPSLQALDFDRQLGVTVEDLGALWRRYNETGTVLQELVAAPRTDQLFRVYAIGPARFVRSLEPLTRQLLPVEPLSPDRESRLVRAADAILARVPWSLCAFDLGLTADHQVEYLDANPDPYLEWWVLGEADFARAVDGAIDLLLSHLTTLAPTPSKALKASSKSRTKKGNG